MMIKRDYEDNEGCGNIARKVATTVTTIVVMGVMMVMRILNDDDGYDTDSNFEEGYNRNYKDD